MIYYLLIFKVFYSNKICTEEWPLDQILTSVIQHPPFY